MFWRFVDERQRIWHRRFVLKQDPPWTTDPILQAGRFCNVYRELDRESVWFIRNICSLGKGKERPELPLEEWMDKWFAAVVFRLFNKGHLFDVIGRPSMYGNWVSTLNKTLRRYKRDHGNPFTSAYVIHSGGREAAEQGLDRIDHYVRVVRWIHAHLAHDIIQPFGTMTPEEQHQQLMMIPSVGPFVGYQIWQDLSYACLIKYTPDQFVVSGPGSRLGLRLLYPSWQRKRENPEALIYRLRRDQIDKLPDDFPRWNNEPLSVANVQNDLCEFAKYVKGKWKEGKQRQKFVPVSPATFYERGVT
jgi:hypothetical protein